MLAPPSMTAKISGRLLASVPQFPLCKMGTVGVGLFLSPGELTSLKSVEKCSLLCHCPSRMLHLLVSVHPPELSGLPETFPDHPFPKPGSEASLWASVASLANICFDWHFCTFLQVLTPSGADRLNLVHLCMACVVLRPGLGVARCWEGMEGAAAWPGDAEHINMKEAILPRAKGAASIIWAHAILPTAAWECGMGHFPPLRGWVGGTGSCFR